VSTQKLLIIVLVVLVVIFVITVGIGGCHGGGDTDDAGAVSALKGLQGNRFLEIGDKATTTCTVGQDMLGRQTLTVTGSCDVTFEKRAFFRRSTRVAFDPSAPVHVVIQPKDGPEQDEQPDAGECFGSAVGRAGGTMRLEQVPLNPAPTITLRRQGCPEE